MSRRTASMNYPPPAMSPVETAHSLLCLSEYAHTLDSLPIDLSRSYGDLRELDAVLSSSMAALTSQINDLVAMIETKSGSNDERLFILNNIAEEAARLKLGGEDKIRVACHAADGLRAHRNHMKALLDQAPDKEFAALAEALARKTVYPHVVPPTRHFYPAGQSGEGGRRNRRAAGQTAGYGSLLTNGEASPAKKRRVARDEDVDVTRTPSKKDRADGAPAQRQRNGGRAKKATERAASPTESVVSVASHIPQPMVTHATTVSARQTGSNGRAGSSGTSAAAKRAAAHAHTTDARYSAQPPSANHPSLPPPQFMGPAQPGALADARAGVANGLAAEWPHGQLEGPGMPVVRGFHQHQHQHQGHQNLAAAVHELGGVDGGAISAGGGDVDGDGEDNRTYCFCDGVSYGEMIACDDEECEREWFHIACVGLTDVPTDKWYCSKCVERRQQAQKKPGRGGKKRSGGGRAGARNHAA